MRDMFHLRDSFTPQLIKKLPTDLFDLKGTFHMEHWRKGKSGLYELIGIQDFTNGVSNQGKNYLLNCGFVSGTQIMTTTWFMSLIDQAGFIALAATDTMSSKGWNEFTHYTQSTRPIWGPATSTAQLLTNPTLCQFDISATGVVMGGFIVGGSSGEATIGSTTGTLWTSGQFGSPTNVTAGTDQLRLIYNLAA